MLYDVTMRPQESQINFRFLVRRVGVSCLHVSLCRQKKGYGTLELKLQTVTSCHVDDRNRTQVLWESIQVSPTPGIKFLGVGIRKGRVRGWVGLWSD